MIDFDSKNKTKHLMLGVTAVADQFPAISRQLAAFEDTSKLTTIKVHDKDS